MPVLGTIFEHFASPLRFDHLPAWGLFLLFALLCAPIVRLGRATVRWQGVARGWTSVGLRLALIWVLLMTLAGARWMRECRDLQVVVLRDVSDSTANAVPRAGGSVQERLDDLLKQSAGGKRPDDRLGVVRFSDRAIIERMPSRQWSATSLAVNDGGQGTDLSSAVQLGLASFHADAMKRLVLVSDGNATQGRTSDALAAASAAHVPIDVIPLRYARRHDVLMERLIAPTSLREGEPLTVEAMLRATDGPLAGKVSLFHRGTPLDLDARRPGVQPTVPVTLNAGVNAIRMKLSPLNSGLNEFHAVFEPDDPSADPVRGNNQADTFVFVRGRGSVLYVDNTPPGEGDDLAAALVDGDALRLERIGVHEFPTRLADLQMYDAVILANVPRGPEGFSDEQDRMIAQYVRDLGGGLVVIGGPDALGAGGWQGSAMEGVLPVNMDIPADRVLPAGALVLVLDHSGSMREAMPGGSGVTRQQVANESAVLALKTLLKDDHLGVVSFASTPTWAVALAPNRTPEISARCIREISPDGGTMIGPALELACSALVELPAKDISAKRILLLTDGQSQPHNYDALLARLNAAHIALSTVAIGKDSDTTLLRALAARGHGSAYVVDDPRQLMQVFVREARTLRRTLIAEPRGGIAVNVVDQADALLKGLPEGSAQALRGMVLTSPKFDPLVSLPLRARNSHNDPILASWRAGLGKTAVFTGDASRRWASAWVSSGAFSPFWRQLVRDIARPGIGSDFDAQIVRDGNSAKLVIDTVGRDGKAPSFLNFVARVSRPDAREPAADIQVQQTGPGRYEAPLATPAPGNYIAAVQYHTPAGDRGTLIAGASVGASPELSDLSSNEAMLTEIAARTGGRVLPALDAGSADLFSRENIEPAKASMPLWDILLAVSMALVVMDVASRRVAIDWRTTKQMVASAAQMVRQFTLAPMAQSTATLAALRGVREDVSRRRFSSPILPMPAQLSPKMERAAGAASAEPPAGSLLEAKRRAREVIRQRADGTGDLSR